jgi:hypothetical protein
MLAALELDLGVRTTALLDKKAATKCNTDSSAAGARRRADPVLKAMGVDGLTMHCGSTTGPEVG